MISSQHLICISSPYNWDFISKTLEFHNSALTSGDIFISDVQWSIKATLCSASLLELNNDSIEQDRICQLLTRECSEVLSQLLTYRKCFEQVRQRFAREICKQGKVLVDYWQSYMVTLKSQSHKETKVNKTFKDWLD